MRLCVSKNVCYDSCRGGAAMTDLIDKAPKEITPRGRRRVEVLAFLVLAFGIWPLVAVGVVGGYGFLVWMFQIIYGPPGPPAGH